MFKFTVSGRLFFSGLISLVLWSCGGNVMTENQGSDEVEEQQEIVSLSVVVTTDVLCDLTKQIAMDTVAVNCLVDAGVDPHVYQATPNDRRAMEEADLILYGGYGFEPSLIQLVSARGEGATAVAVYEQAVTTPLMMGDDDDHDHGHSHDHGDDDEEKGKFPDPHVWHNGENGMEIVKVISAELAKLAPDQQQLYQSQQEQLITELTELHQWIKAEVEQIPTEKRILVTNHDALGYYLDAYNLKSNTALAGVSTEEAPNSRRVAELVGEIQRLNIPTIFVESSVNPTLMETVAREAGVKLASNPLYVDGLGATATGADTYQQMLRKNTQTIVDNLMEK